MKKLSRGAKRKIREAVFERDGRHCLLAWHSPCFGGLTPHHIIKASQGGAYSEENLITLCAGHNDFCEDHPREARELGFVRSRPPGPPYPLGGARLNMVRDRTDGEPDTK